MLQWTNISGRVFMQCAHRNRHNGDQRVIKLMMPHSKGEHSDEFKLAVVETELHQKLGASEYIASIHSWGTFDGKCTF